MRENKRHLHEDICSLQTFILIQLHLNSLFIPHPTPSKLTQIKFFMLITEILVAPFCQYNKHNAKYTVFHQVSSYMFFTPTSIKIIKC